MIYLHTPKCAGTTVITALIGVYADSLYYDRAFRKLKQRHLSWQWQKHLSLERNEEDLFSPNIECIAGHFTWNKYRYLNWPMFVFLRAPHERIISQYSIGENREHSTFEKYCRDGANSISRMVGDLQQYFFVGLQEHFEESMRMLEWYADIEFTWPLEYRNHHKREKYSWTKEDRQVFVECNKDDIELYDQARVRFYEQRRQYEREEGEAEASERRA